MDLEGAAGLYRLNISVDKVVLVNQCNQGRKPVCLQAFFWGLPVISIYPSHLCNCDEGTEPNVYKNFEIGTTGYFHSGTIELIRSIQRHSILMKIFQNYDEADTPQAIGTSAVKVTEKFSELISQAATCAGKHGISGTIDGVYNVMDKNNIQVGTVSLQVQLICYDNTLLKTPLTLLAEQCNPSRAGQPKYLLPQRTADGYVLVPADVLESNSDRWLSGCEDFKEKKQDEPPRKEVIWSKVATKYAAVSSRFDISNLERDESVSESVITGNQSNEFLLFRNPPIVQDERGNYFESQEEEIPGYAVDLRPRKDVYECERSRIDGVPHKLSMETCTSDNEEPLDNTQCLRTPSSGQKSYDGSQEPISPDIPPSLNCDKIRDSIEIIRRSSIAMIACKERTCEDQISSARIPCKSKIIQTDEYNSSEWQQDLHSEIRELPQENEDQENEVSSFCFKCSLKQSQISSGSSLEQEKVTFRSPTPPQCVTFADRKITSRIQHCKSPESVARTANVLHAREENSSTRKPVYSPWKEPMEVQFSELANTTPSATPSRVGQSCVWDEAFETGHSYRPKAVKTCLNARPILRTSSPLSCIHDETTAKQLSASQHQGHRILTRPSLHRQNCMNVEALENQPPDFHPPCSEIDALQEPSQPSNILWEQVQGKEEHNSPLCHTENTSAYVQQLSSECCSNGGSARRRSSRDRDEALTPSQGNDYQTVKVRASEEFEDNDKDECDPCRDCGSKQSERSYSENRTFEELHQKCEEIDQRTNYLDNVYFNSRPQQVIHGYCPPMKSIDTTFPSQDKDSYDVGFNAADATPHQNAPLALPQTTQAVPGYCCVGNDFNYSIGCQQPVQGYSTPLEDFNSGQFLDNRVVDSCNAQPNAAATNTPQYQCTQQTSPQLRTENCCTNNTAYGYPAGTQQFVHDYCTTTEDITPQRVSHSKAVDGFSFPASAVDETSEYQDFTQIKMDHGTDKGRPELEQSFCVSHVDIGSGQLSMKSAETGLEREFNKSISGHRLYVSSTGTLVASEKRQCDEELQLTHGHWCDNPYDMSSQSQCSLRFEGEPRCSECGDKLCLQASGQNTVNASGKLSTSTMKLWESKGALLVNQRVENQFNRKSASLGHVAGAEVYAHASNSVHNCGVNAQADIIEEFATDVYSPRTDFDRCGTIGYAIDGAVFVSKEKVSLKISQRDLAAEYLRNAEDPEKSGDYLTIPPSPTSPTHEKESEDDCQFFLSESPSSVYRKSDSSEVSETSDSGTRGCVSRRSSVKTEPRGHNLSPFSVSATLVYNAATEGASSMSRLQSVTQTITRKKQNTCSAGARSNNVANTHIGLFLTQACSRATSNNTYSTRFSKPRGAHNKIHSHHNGHHHYYECRETDHPRGSWVSNVSMNSTGADSCICMNNRCVWLKCRTY